MVLAVNYLQKMKRELNSILKKILLFSNVIFSLGEFYFISSENAIASNFSSKLKDLIIEGKDQLINKMIFQRPPFHLMTHNYKILTHFTAYISQNNL